MTISEEIELHMARAFFASAWADQVDNSDEGPNLSGKEIMDEMPTEIDSAARHAAKTLHFEMVRANPVPDEFRCGLGLEYLFQNALASRVEGKGDRPLTPENFGHYCAMQAMGHGVGLHDAFGKTVYEMIQVPYVEFGSASLAKDYYPQRGEPS
jgi:hypothetical protein